MILFQILLSHVLKMAFRVATQVLLKIVFTNILMVGRYIYLNIKCVNKLMNVVHNIKAYFCGSAHLHSLESGRIKFGFGKGCGFIFSKKIKNYKSKLKYNQL